MISSPRYLILMLTNQCNLSCSYCYLGSNRKKAKMGMDMSQNTIDQALGLVGKDQNYLHVQLTGGEPFLVPDLIEYAAQKTREIYPDASIGIQTNATLLNDKAINIIQRFNLKTGISLDGEPPLQEAQRGKAAATFKGLHLMEQRKVPFNVTCVVTAANVDKLHRLVLLLGGFSMAKGIGLDFLVLTGNAKKYSVLKAEPDQINSSIKNMLAALNMINAGRQTPFVIRELEKLKAIKAKNSATPFCHAEIGQSLAVTPEGKLFPCSQTAHDSKFYLGTLDNFKEEPNKPQDLFSQPRAGGLNRLSQISGPLCMDCPLKTACPGDCPSRIYYNQTDTMQLICIAYQVFYKSLYKDKAVRPGTQRDSLKTRMQ